MKEINILVGHKGSGKSTVLEMINTFGFYTTELSIQMENLKTKGIKRDEPFGKWDIGAISLVYEHCLNVVPETPIFLGGFSRPSEVEYLKNCGLPCRVMAIRVNDNVRHKRLLTRGRVGEEHLEFSDFKLRDLRRLGVVENYETNDLLGLFSLSEYDLENNGSLYELNGAVEGMLKHFKYIQ